MRVNIVPNLAALNNVGIKMQVSGTPVTKISVMIHLDSGLFTGIPVFILPAWISSRVFPAYILRRLIP